MKNATQMAILAHVVEETVSEVGERGAPTNIIYVALMAPPANVTMEEFNAIIDALVETGRVRRENHVLYSTGMKAGR